MTNSNMRRERRQTRRAVMATAAANYLATFKTGRRGPFSRIGFSVFLVAAVGYIAMALYLNKMIYSVQPGSYMDEIFHVRQTQKYCNGTYLEWDPKITTLPGTYVMASVFYKVIHLIFRLKDFCSVYYLRVFNIWMSIQNFGLVYLILGYHNPDIHPLKRVLASINVATVPILYFFTFFFYTDTISTYMLLNMHILHLRGWQGMAALAGFYAVFTRQTNIVWVFYHGVNTILEILTTRYHNTIFLIPTKYYRVIKASRNPTRANIRAQNQFAHVPTISRMWEECGEEFFKQGYPYVIVGACFALFVIINGSIVVGDKDAHQASINLPQFFYFALVFGTFGCGFILCRIRSLIAFFMKNWKNTLYLMCFAAVIILMNSPAHPYLLADNRHYTFYVWRRFFTSMPLIRFFWIPFYFTVWVLICSSMRVHQVIVCNFTLAVFINLTPQLLLEFRYFIPAYLYARLTFKEVSWTELFIEFLVHTGFNMITFYHFINSPFEWPDTPGQQRFMW